MVSQRLRANCICTTPSHSMDRTILRDRTIQNTKGKINSRDPLYNLYHILLLGNWSTDNSMGGKGEKLVGYATRR
jgi:hypothetical protein